MTSTPHQNERWLNIQKQINNALHNMAKRKRNRAPINQNTAGLTQSLSVINLPKLYNSPVKPPRSLTR